MKEYLQLRSAFAAILFIGLFAMAARNVLDPDIWWHLKTGEWIAQNRAVPHSDPFSYTRTGQPWIAHEWLSELAIYSIYRWAGYAGLIIAFAAIISASFVPLYLRCKGAAVASGAMTVWGALATAVVWGVRPQILSFFLLSVWLLILERSENEPKLLWWTLPLTVLWVNLHAGFILGPVFLGLFIVGEFLEMLFGSQQVPRRQLTWLLLALLADLAMVPLNPNGASIFRYPVETLRSSAMQSRISEWASPNFHLIDYGAFFLLVLATFVTLAFSRRRTRLRDILVLLASIAAALSSVRMIPLFVLIAVPLFSRPLRADKPSARLPPSRSAILNAGILLAMLGFAAAHTSQVIRGQIQAEATHYPADAVGYLRRHPPEGSIFNHYDWGGYLIFKLYPEMPVFIDGRADVYGERLMQQFGHTYYLQDGWQQPLSEWKVTTVIVPPDSALASALRLGRSWSISFEDSIAVVFSTSMPKVAAANFGDSTGEPQGRVSIRPSAPYRSAINYTLPLSLRGMMWVSNWACLPCGSRAH